MMLKKSIKILVVAIIIFSILAVLGTTIFNSHKSIAYSVGSTYYFDALRDNDNLYCVDHMLSFRPGYYYCTETSTTSREMAYLVGTREGKGGSDAENDVVSNAIWELIDGSGNSSVAGEVDELLAEAEASAEINLTGNLTLIKAPENPIIEDGSKQFGPFAINYPQVNGKLGGGKVTILLNGKEVEKETLNQAEFYFTEEDGILYGEENKVEFIYEATYYTGTESTFTPYMELEKEIECPECGATNTAILENGVFINGRLKKYNCDWEYDEDIEHNQVYELQLVDVYEDVYNEETGLYERVYVGQELQKVKVDCPYDGEWDEDWGDDSDAYMSADEEDLLDSLPSHSGYSGYQDVIYIDPEEDPIEEKIPYNFYIKPIIEINLNKIDTANQSVEGLQFNVNVTGGALDGSNTIVTSAGGNKITIKPTEADTITLTLTETPNIYYMDMDPIVITFEYRAGRWTPIVGTEKDQVSITGDNIRIFGLNVQNIAKIQNLRLVKLNSSVLGETIPGVTFRITLTNAKTLAGGQLITGTTNSNGEIDLGTLIVEDPSKAIGITLEEVAVPDDGLNYNGLYSSKDSATIAFFHKQAGTASSNQLVDANYNLTTNTVSLNVENIVTMDVSGMVWLDGQTGLKPVQAPNGEKDNSEKGIEGVTVDLVRDNGTIYFTDITDANGNYEFTDAPASVRGAIKYNVEFTYDGINYIATEAGVGSEDVDSDAVEVNRESFNNKFATIEKDKPVGKDGKPILEYAYSDDKATLETMSNGTVKQEFAMTATTKPTSYDKNTSNIDLGLIKKGVDLAAVTDIYSAKVSINGEDKVYDYNDIQELEKDANNNPIIDNLQNENVKYNLYLYNSDYNYRIGSHYQLPEAAQADGLSGTSRDKNGLLNVEVTYQILLNNQSATDATINEIAYYYDTKYELKEVLTSGVTVKEGPQPVTINGTTYNKVILEVNQEFTDSDNQGIVEIVFTVLKDNDGNLLTGTMQNWVEITSYSTKNSCIDKDSAPDNIGTHKNEDDTDDAAGLHVQLNFIEREVSGYVFEDKKTTNDAGKYNTGNGKYDDRETKINGVIVQLVEIKYVTVGNTTQRLEYIWQEMVSGSKKVQVLSNDGTKIMNIEYTPDESLNGKTFTESGKTYTYKYIEEDLGNGEYKFVDFIPGDYIVRFVYGDDTYYSDASAANLLKYNGQDYKSTVDIYYNKAYYDITYPENSSMARDNEARRLEVMAYATSEKDASKLQIDTKEELEKTWMCAETSLILMKVSDAEEEGDSIRTNALTRGVNFGLVERPRANLVLEKHITGLKISGIVEATTELSKYDEYEKKLSVYDNYEINKEEKVELIYNSGEPIVATGTSKTENTIGDWTIETDVDEIGGKKLDITYSYRITNTGDADYIGAELSKALASGKTYSEIAAQVKDQSTKSGYTPGAYLGTAYYNGNKTTDVVASIPFQVEDYIGVEEGLELDTTSSFKQGAANVDKNVYKYENSNSTQKNPVSVTEKVNVLQSKDIFTLYAKEQANLTLTVYDASLDSTSTRDDFTYRSYAAQLIYPTSGPITSETGSLCDGITLSNLNAVKTYVEESSVEVSKVVPEADEFMGETVIITMNTGADKVTPVILIISITAGLAIIAVGVVLVKKFVI